MKKLWVVRAGKGGEFLEEFLAKKIVAIGWDRIGSLENMQNREAITAEVMSCWPEYKKNQARVVASHLFRFSHEIQEGDGVITYDRMARIHWLGVIKSEYRFDPSLGGHCPHIRLVAWEHEVPRDKLTISTKNRLGSIATLFLVAPEAAAEVYAIAHGKEEPVVDEAEEEADEEFLFEDIQARSREFIKDRLNEVNWEEMQQIVAGLLRAMGYKTRISPPGADRGRDVIASPDGFGFEQPRIVVEVKHRQNSMGAPEIRSFLGGRHKDDKGLYVSTGGFTREAVYEAERASIPVTLMDLDELVDGLLERYEALDPDVRSLIPLKKLYWPA